jgi:hypothetical protein
LEIAQGFWQKQGHDLSDYHSAVTFRADHSAKDYIDQQAGLATLNRLAQEEISLALAGVLLRASAIRGYRWWGIWVASCFQLSHQRHGDFIFVFANGPPYP